MNIDFTKDQYQTLLKLMYCGEWVLNSYKTSEDKTQRETDKFEQYIFSFAKGYGLEKWVELDEESGLFFPTYIMEDEFHEFVDKYNQKQREE